MALKYINKKRDESGSGTFNYDDNEPKGEGIIAMIIILMILAFSVYFILKEEKTLEKVSIGEKYILKKPENPFAPFSSDTLTILDVKEDYILYKYKSGNLNFSTRKIIFLSTFDRIK